MFDPDLPEIRARLEKWLSDDTFAEPEQKFERMKELCAKFGHPERTCPVFHVAGSKGKGSTSAYIAGILDEAGYKVGRLSSPYVAYFGERFQCGEEYFTEAEYVAAMDELEKGLVQMRAEKLPHSILMTLYAFLLFRATQCDFMVIEVGMGGRLDPTNVVTPEVCAITTIEMEHQKFLGDTLAKIAGEKAGIIKPGVSVVVAGQKPEAREVILEKAEAVGAEVIEVDLARDLAGMEYFFADSYDEYTGRLLMRAELKNRLFPGGLNLDLKMLGRFQAENALVAASVVKLAKLGIKDETFARGMAKIELPGRFDIRRGIFGYDGIPYLIIDGAHTPGSVRGGVDVFRELRRIEGVKNAQDSCLTDFLPGAKPLLLFSTASDKAVEEMARELGADFPEVILTTLEGKETDTERLKRAFKKGTFVDDTKEAVQMALSKANAERRPLVILGSMYLAGTVYRELERKWRKVGIFS